MAPLVFRSLGGPCRGAAGGIASATCACLISHDGMSSVFVAIDVSIDQAGVVIVGFLVIRQEGIIGIVFQIYIGIGLGSRLLLFGLGIFEGDELDIGGGDGFLDLLLGFRFRQAARPAFEIGKRIGHTGIGGDDGVAVQIVELAPGFGAGP